MATRGGRNGALRRNQGATNRRKVISDTWTNLEALRSVSAGIRLSQLTLTAKQIQFLQNNNSLSNDLAEAITALGSDL